MFISSFDRITVLHYSYGCATSSAAYLCKRYLQNHWVTLHLCVFSLKCSLCLLGLLTESLDYTTLMGAPPLVQRLVVSSTYRITGVNYTYGCLTLSLAYCCLLYLQNHWVTLHLRVRHLKCV